MKSFIEEQFPVSKISKESYKERKAGAGQTLTGLGKWWGRKPLILVRSALLGLLMPVSPDKKKDLDIFLKILTMDKKGLYNRMEKTPAPSEIFEYLTNNERVLYFESSDNGLTPKYRKDISAAEKKTAIDRAWNRMSYDQKLRYCRRPEQYTDTDSANWQEINRHLGTDASTLPELIKQLGIKRFGQRSKVGDCFCGGGSVPFEAARMGCDVFASDLNPIAGLLTWSALNILGASDEEIQKLEEFRQKVYDEADRQVLEWGIETNEHGDRADSYIYCVEATCPECGYIIPLAPSWIIGKGTKTIAILKEADGRYDIEIKSNAGPQEIKLAESQATVKDNAVHCPHCNLSTPISSLRKDRTNPDGSTDNDLRKWEKSDFMPREGDIYRERLYCIRYQREVKGSNIKMVKERYYTAPTPQDLQREEKVIELLSERFKEWQDNGYIPSTEIEPGDKTDEPIRTRGWTHWHHLFNPRQLLVHGLILKKISLYACYPREFVISLLGINRAILRDSKLSMWDNSRDGVVSIFYNQAFNTMYNHGSKSIVLLNFDLIYNLYKINSQSSILPVDARELKEPCHIWITDPPYADAVNYHELSEFFLAWDRVMLEKAFPEWYADSKRVLAVRGKDDTFNSSMIDIYKNLADNMPDDGMQIIMFTHQDVNVWADLTLIIWSAGLQVTAAWNIATETESAGLKEGNYVKGTVLLVLRKQTSDETAFIDDIYPDIEEEVKKQINSMKDLDSLEEPNFSDADYILAAYAASLKVLTSYRKIEDINVGYELSKDRKKGDKSPVAKLIESAKKIAYDQLIPKGFDSFIWKTLMPEERFYIKGLEMESYNVYKMSAYQELARGFGVADYKSFMDNTRANTARLKTAGEWANRGIKADGFGNSLLRNVLMALYLGHKQDNVSSGRNWLRNEVEDYWSSRDKIREMLEFISGFMNIGNMQEWHRDAETASILLELVRNDTV